MYHKFNDFVCLLLQCGLYLPYLLSLNQYELLQGYQNKVTMVIYQLRSVGILLVDHQDCCQLSYQHHEYHHICMGNEIFVAVQNFVYYI